MDTCPLVAPDDTLCGSDPEAVATRPSPETLEQRIAACIDDPEPFDWSNWLLTEVYGKRP